MPIYFDTNIIRYLRDGLTNHALAQEEKRQIVLSPISVLELVAQVACVPEEALGAIHEIGSWADTANLQLLGWRDAFLAYWVFAGDSYDELSGRLKRVLQVCHASVQPAPSLQEDARHLWGVLKEAKRRKAELMEKAVAAIRRLTPNCTNDELSAGARRGLASGLRSQVGASDEVPDGAVAACLVAYFEYHANMVQMAFRNENFNFSRHGNDHFDAEQLIFLADPSLHFFTADTGYRNTAMVEPRIHLLEACDVRDPAVAPGLIAAEIRETLR